jgi:hypothetical protein
MCSPERLTPDRHRVAVPFEPVVAADDKHRRVGAHRLQLRCATCLDLQVGLARQPLGQAGLKRARRIRAEAREFIALRFGEGKAQADHDFGRVAAEGRMAVAG